MSNTSIPPDEVTKVGNLTGDLTLAFSAKGLAYAKGGLAWAPYDPETRTSGETVFYDLTIFGELAEHAAECLTKGMRVIATGRPELYTPEPTKDNPEPKTRRQIVVRAIGPDLRWQTAKIDKVQRSGPPQKAPANLLADEEPF